MLYRCERSIACLGIIIILLVVLAGCGYKPEKPVYDTKANPEDFPQTACALLERIESRRLTDFESITNAFARLYGENPSLLDNDDWHKVISRLGAKFQYFGDQEAEKGIEHYRRAGGYYDLAAFARPDDLSALKQSRLFSAWQQGIVDSIVETTGLDALLSNPASLGDRIDFVKRFIFGDSLHREFARQYLVHQLLGRPGQDKAAADSVINRLTTVDRVFLSSLGLADMPFDDPVAQFVDPAVDLIAYQLVRLGEHDYRAELYFVPRKRITTDYTVALRIDTRDSARSERFAGSGHYTFDFYPDEPTSQWAVNEVTAVGRLFTFRDPVTDIEVGLYAEQDRRGGWASIAGVTDSVITLPVASGSKQ